MIFAAFLPPFDDARGSRRLRFMESADINTAFREVFKPLRTNIRRGMTVEGQLYAIEMDACIPGEMLGTAWIPPVSRGIEQGDWLTDIGHRHAVFERLFAEPRPEALFAYVTERPGRGEDDAILYVEIASVDACYAAEFAILPGAGWHRRELVERPHRRLARVSLS